MIKIKSEDERIVQKLDDFPVMYLWKNKEI